MRRYVSLMLMGGLFVALMLSVEDPPAPPPPFLGVATPLEGKPFLVRSADRIAGARGGSILIRREGQTEDRVRAGQPAAVAAATDEAIHLLFSDPGSSTRLEWSDDLDAELAWTRILCSDPAFEPLVATGIADGTILVVGRLPGPDESHILAWASLSAERFETRDQVPPREKFARHLVLVRHGDGADLVWTETTATGIAVMAFALPSRGDLQPRQLAETSEVRGLVGLQEHAAVLVLRDGANVTTVALDGSTVEEGRIQDLPESDQARFAALTNPARLVSVDAGRVLTWALDETSGSPTIQGPVDLLPREDNRWMLLALAITSATIIGVLIALSSRGVGFHAIGRVNDGPEYAGIGRRLLAWVLDSMLVQPLLWWLVGAWSGMDPVRLAGPLLQPGGGDTQNLVALINALVLAYFVVAEAVFGQTLGKRALMIRTVSLDGGRAGLGAVLIRNLLRYIPDFFGGALLVFLSPKRQRVGDWAARTVVVRMRRLELPGHGLVEPPTADTPMRDDES